MGHILIRVVAGAFALVMALSLLSFYYNDPCPPFSQGQVGGTIQNICGLFGAYVAGFLQTIAGVGAWLVPLYVLWECFPASRPRWYQRLAWLVLALVAWTSLGAFGSRTFPALNGIPANQWRWGGWVGASLWLTFRRILGPVGLPLVLGTLALVSLLILAPVLIRGLASLLKRWMGDKAWPWIKPLPSKGARGFLGMLRHGFLRKKNGIPDLDARDARELSQLQERQRAEEESIESLNRAEREALEYKRANQQAFPDAGLPVISSMRLDTADEIPLPIDSLVIEGERDTPGIPLPPPALLRDLPPPPPPKPPLVEPVVARDRFGRVVEQPPLGLTEPTPLRPLPDMEPSPSRRDPGPSSRPRTEPLACGPVDRLELPPRRLFDPPQQEHRVDPAFLESTKALIGQKLAEFKVKGQMVGMQPGPVVTVYEFQPDPGVPLAKVLGMEEDLALGLQAEKVRIDRIPGRNLVGIEVPNQRREIISFREVVDSAQFRDPSQKDARSLLTLALGKDIAGHPVVTDLGKMPHLLIGGSTGSGKSVGVNAMICSLLLRAMPSEVKLILVDPKMVELGIYEDIPHLWAPVVTDMKEAGRVLKWVVAQMEDRYKRLAMLSVRNLEGFNAKLLEAGGSIDLTDRTPNPRWMDRPAFLEPLPYVVVIIDELADLMMVCRAEVEESIARIAQKARAVGIHLILATQRPSVDIVTGVIKANLPARLSYRVNSKIDSRTILDGSGGEQLLGKGDALFLAPGNARPRRIHAPLITEEEILRLAEWLKERGRPDYNKALLDAMATEEDAAAQTPEGALTAGGDDIYDRAVAVVKRERKASTSLLQRKLNIGYGRAARLIDRMEEEGLIGQDRGAGKPREVLVGEE
ncbi:MAG TPA: DNA translocase FtsK 4TM domain-containing protein [Holophaga sp.]|nr:DNA translocase FtsK 4TM domain-containing protein [Holophaga sp.]HPS67162.1 DNA translocase FtsK 4TM domain-containing protein [Holophaga sp.]